ncbi:50S ribosomal protein L11 methyltransferase [Capillimicrobium parvum]|uniref:Ribosomal protein L11 methyltransferase n=1 Tax=Capillimicrobium parvum TaxID=2884022 RepID=A0A9E7C291_9ACTN|nr:50S ribosomal protein L11 methyltransferase [Capillimicrobium parvum]UGS37499.1 Ribosomal protein L11 methyltransferase [Capillimicrobium parvum]
MIRLAVRVARADAELALAELLVLAPEGVEEVDAGDDVVEYAIYGAEGELPDLGEVRAAAGEALVEVSSTVVGDDWAQRWREFHRPLQLAGLRLRAPWHEAQEGLEVVIDPGQAFGTGMHPTTRLCLELLLAEPAARRACPLADLGCGSGVLAIAAAKLGWAPVDGYDHEAESVQATIDNAAANGVEVGAHPWDLRRDPIPQAPTAAANLLRPLLLELAERMTAPPETLIASGLLEAEAGEVAEAFARHGLREHARRSRDGWAAVLLRRAAA